ncbi:MAG: DUF4926 domain-containing protein [Thermoanaerobaculia bacterium]
MINELDMVVLRRALPAYGIEEGDIGTVVHRYRDGEAMEVEFITGEGETIAVETLEAGEVRPLQRREILHARELAA